MRKKKRIDWDKELQKTEEIRMKGLRISILSFAFAVLFIFGVSRLNKEVSPFPYITLIGCFVAATVLIVFIFKKRASKHKITQDEDNKEIE